MSKLLRANMMRLWRSKAFWLGFLILTAFGAMQRIAAYMDIEMHYLDETFWIDAIMIGIILSVFISLFVGAEFDNGTIRNKVILGHTRSEIYFANVIVCIIAGWLMCFGCLVSSLLVGIPLLGFFHGELAVILQQGICVFALSAAYTAIYCFIAMLNSNRTITAIISILLSFSLLLFGAIISNRLDESEYYYIPDSSLGIGGIDDGQNSEWIQNPDYLEGPERRIYETLFEVFPGGQSLQLSGMTDESHRYPIMFLASLGWIILSSGFGVVVFQKRDLR